jgi:hypothetical protein
MGHKTTISKSKITDLSKWVFCDHLRYHEVL